MAGKRTRIMYIEQKSGANAGEARIGRVTFSRKGRTLYYKDLAFVTAKGRGIWGNYDGFDREQYLKFVNTKLEPGKNTCPGYVGEFWISGPKRNGEDRHYAETAGPVAIDEDVAEEYWTKIRGVAQLG